MKNIIICCDGTGNEYSSQLTNVVDAYKILMNKPKNLPDQYDIVE